MPRRPPPTWRNVFSWALRGEFRAKYDVFCLQIREDWDDQRRTIGTALMTVCAQREILFYELLCFANRWQAAGLPYIAPDALQSLQDCLVNFETVGTRVMDRYRKRRRNSQFTEHRYSRASREFKDLKIWAGIDQELDELFRSFETETESLRARSSRLHTTATATLGPDYESNHDPVVLKYPLPDLSHLSLTMYIPADRFPPSEANDLWNRRLAAYHEELVALRPAWSTRSRRGGASDTGNFLEGFLIRMGAIRV